MALCCFGGDIKITNRQLHVWSQTYGWNALLCYFRWEQLWQSLQKAFVFVQPEIDTTIFVLFCRDGFNVLVQKTKKYTKTKTQ